MRDQDETRQSEEVEAAATATSPPPQQMAPALPAGLLQRKLALRLQRRALGQGEPAAIAAGARAPIQRQKVVPAGDKLVEQAPEDVNSSREPKGQENKYAFAKGVGFRRVYQIGKHNVLVFLPADGITPPSVNVFVFFHGDVASYASTSTNAWEHKPKEANDDNPAAAMELAQQVTNSGKNVIAIAPEMSAGGKAAWSEMQKDASFDKIVGGVLQQLSDELGLRDANRLKSTTIAIAGHSGGGAALGPAVAAMDADAVSEVTLQEAGYGFEDSWKKLDHWFLSGQKAKKIRTISISKALTPDKGDPKAEEHATRRVLKEDYYQTVHDKDKEKQDAEQGITEKGKPKKEFKQIHSYTQYGLYVNAIKQSIADLKLDPKAIQITQVPVDQDAAFGGATLTLEYRIDVSGLPGGTRSIEVYRGGGTHFGARNQTIGALIKQGAQ